MTFNFTGNYRSYKIIPLKQLIILTYNQWIIGQTHSLINYSGFWNCYIMHNSSRDDITKTWHVTLRRAIQVNVSQPQMKISYICNYSSAFKWEIKFPCVNEADSAVYEWKCSTIWRTCNKRKFLTLRQITMYSNIRNNPWLKGTEKYPV